MTVRPSFVRRLSAVLACGLLLSASGAPFAQWFDDVQPDGSVIRIWGEGNDYQARFETAAGQTIVFNADAQRYEYVRRDEKSGALVGIGVFLGAETGREAEVEALPLHLRDTSEAAREKARARFERLDRELRMTERWREVRKEAEARDEKIARMKSGKHDGPSPVSTTIGNVTGVTILVDFPITNALGQVTNTTAGVTGERDVHGRAYVTGLLNGVGWHEDGNYASVRDFYYEMSVGRLNFTNVVTDWVLAPKPRSYYDNPRRDNGECAHELIGDVFDVIRNDPDYSTKYLPLLQAATLTSGSSGSVVAFNVLFAGGPASRWSYGLWQHQWDLSPTQSDKLRWTAPDGSSQAFFSVYQITPVRSESIDAAPVIGTICHEDGHMICGFPDYYHYTDYYNEGVGNWSLMCSASSLNGGRSPGGIDAYSRLGVGWATAIDVTPTQGWVRVTNDFSTVYRYKNPSNDECFLFENRQKTGPDRALPGAGVLIWRCRPGYSNMDAVRAGDASAYASLSTDARAGTNRWSGELSLEQADGRYDLERGSGRGDANDVWYKGNRGRAHAAIAGSGYKGLWNDDTAACARWWDGTPSGLQLSHFSANGQVMSFFVGAFVGPVDSPCPSLPSFAAEGAALAFTEDGFEVRIDNAAFGVYYTVFTSSALGEPFTARDDSTLADASGEMRFAVDDSAPSLFVRIVASDEPFSEGDELPADAR